MRVEFIAFTDGDVGMGDIVKWKKLESQPTKYLFVPQWAFWKSKPKYPFRYRKVKITIETVE